MQFTIDNSKAAELGFGKLSEFEGRTINLLTLKELANLKEFNPQTQLVSIFGIVKDAGEANDDDRFGYVAYALLSDIG